MVTGTKRSRWEYDPTWIRVEHVDSEGRQLGYTEFEPAPKPLAMRSREIRSRGKLLGGMVFSVVYRLPALMLQSVFLLKRLVAGTAP